MTSEKIRISRETRKVIATMAIENMYVSKELLKKIESIENGERTIADVKKELIKKHVRH